MRTGNQFGFFYFMFGLDQVAGVFGVTRQQPTMMNLFPVEDSSDVKQKNDVFPRQSSFSSSSSSGAKEEVEKITENE